MYEMSDEEFEQAISDALDSIPDEFLDQLENVAIMVADEPEEWQLEESGDEEDDDLLGFYNGVNLLDRADGYGLPGDLPDTITIFKGPHERLDGGREEVLEEVRRTVVHEIGHYFGMSEEQITAMGYA